MAERIIYGQAWIVKDQLVQDTTTFTSDFKCLSSVKVLVENIWDDLLSSGGTYKYNDKKDYFYWEYEMTSMEDDTITVTMRYECPKPPVCKFEDPYDVDSAEGEYAKYWVNKYKLAHENGEAAMAIQRKEILLKGTSYVDQNGDLIEIDDITINNDDLGDISNLLSLF